jgi:RNA polymerase sigma-70 factor (subfamily 1)
MPSGPRPDEELRDVVARAGAGDDPSLDALLIRYLPRLRAFVRVRTNPLVRQLESCSDLVQSVCREVLQGASRFQYQGEGPFRAWLFRTALNKILERTRNITQQKRDVRREVPADGRTDGAELPAHDPSASQMAAANELGERMERALDQIPEHYREVIALSRIVGLSHAEIAEQTGRTEGAVRTMLSRALVAYIDALDRGANSR